MPLRLCADPPWNQVSTARGWGSLELLYYCGLAPGEADEGVAPLQKSAQPCHTFQGQAVFPKTLYEAPGPKNFSVAGSTWSAPLELV
jgi:hypothetical protein